MAQFGSRNPGVWGP